MNPHRPFEIVMPIVVKSYDIDLAGIVSNIVYIRWLEDLRLKLLDEYFPLQQQIAEGYGPVLGTTHIEYRRPVRMFDPVEGRMWVERLGRTSWQVQAEFLVNGEVAATATQSGAFVDYTTMRPVAVPAGLREQFAGWSK